MLRVYRKRALAGKITAGVLTGLRRFTENGKIRMRVAFVQNVPDELLGPLQIMEQVRRAGHPLRFFLPGRGWEKKIASWAPHVVALYATTGFHQPVLETARTIKRLCPGPPVMVLGGPHATLFPEVIKQDGIDALCKGEGELAFPQFLSALEQGGGIPIDIPHFRVKKDNEIFDQPQGPLIQDLDSVFFPLREHYFDVPFLRDAPAKRVVASRGCPFSCHFCYNDALRKMVQGKYLRVRSPDSVIEEALYLKKRFGYKILEFVDEAFGFDREWFYSFVEAYGAKVRMPYYIQTHVRFIDQAFAEALSASGCQWVMFGLESGNSRIRNQVLGKNTTEEEIVKAADILRKYKFKTVAYNILGSPGETLETALETVRLNRRVRPTQPVCLVATPYPGTRLAKICEQEGVLPEELKDPDRFSPSFMDTLKIPQKDRRVFENMQKLFQPLVWFPALEPLLMALARLPANGLFRFIQQAGFGYFARQRRRLGLLFTLRLYAAYRKIY